MGKKIKASASSSSSSSTTVRATVVGNDDILEHVKGNQLNVTSSAAKLNSKRVWYDEADSVHAERISKHTEYNHNNNNNKDNDSTIIINSKLRSDKSRGSVSDNVINNDDSKSINEIETSTATVNKGIPAFLKQSHSTPSWAMSATERVISHHNDDDDDDMKEKYADQTIHTSSSSLSRSNALALLSAPSSSTNTRKDIRKRFRSEGLDALLARTEPLLEQGTFTAHRTRGSIAAPLYESYNNYSGVKSKLPSVLSILPLPRDAAHTIHWHYNGQLVIVGCNRHIYTFHAAGSFVEQLSKIYFGKATRVATLTPSHEELIFCAHQSYMPSKLTLATEQIQHLPFLDMRNCAIYRHNRPDSSKSDCYIRKLISRQNSDNEQTAREIVGVVAGRNLRLASLSSGSIIADVAADDFINDAQFTGEHELMLASSNTISVYDIRKTAHFVNKLVDEGALTINTFACTSSLLATGSVSGVVNVFARSALNDSTNQTIPTLPAATQSVTTKTNGNSDNTYKIIAKPFKTLKNLTTPIMSICFGPSSTLDVNNNNSNNNNVNNSNLFDVMAFSARGQKSAFRIAHLPECNVLPSFPAVAMRHGFVQSLAMASSVPILSVGERQKVTNYAL